MEHPLTVWTLLRNSSHEIYGIGPIDPPDKMSQAGFTMIEVLIAMTLFVFGILSLIGLQVSSINGNATARLQTEATTIGTELIERLQMLPENHPDLDASTHYQELLRNNSRSYTVQWVITNHPEDAGTRSLCISVTPDNRVYGKKVTLSTILVGKGSEDRAK